MPASKPEETFALHVRAQKLPEPVREYRAIPSRRWRYDFAWPECYVIAEIHGGTYSSGRHVRGVGFGKDREKINAAQIAGWIVLEFDSKQVGSGYAIDTITECLRIHGAA